MLKTLNVPKKTAVCEYELKYCKKEIAQLVENSEADLEYCECHCTGLIPEGK